MYLDNLVELIFMQNLFTFIYKNMFVPQDWDLLERFALDLPLYILKSILSLFYNLTCNVTTSKMYFSLYIN